MSSETHIPAKSLTFADHPTESAILPEWKVSPFIQTVELLARVGLLTGTQARSSEPRLGAHRRPHHRRHGALLAARPRPSGPGGRGEFWVSDSHATAAGGHSHALPPPGNPTLASTLITIPEFIRTSRLILHQKTKIVKALRLENEES